jgi:hypothetical protein
MVSADRNIINAYSIVRVATDTNCARVVVKSDNMEVFLIIIQQIRFQYYVILVGFLNFKQIHKGVFY